jgi:hypothetical protein
MMGRVKTATPRRLRATPGRLAVLCEFDIAMATQQALAIADALIEARKDSVLLDWLQDQLTTKGNVIHFSRETDETNELSIMVWRGPADGVNEGCTHWIAGEIDVRSAIREAQDNGEKNEAAFYGEEDSFGKAARS